MRNISATGLAKLAERHGNEPITIVEVDWVKGKATAYADRTVGTIPGRIIEVGDLDDAVNISGNSDSQELTITLDDTDGSIKAILDSHDVHKRDARVYQYFSGLDISDKFLLFSGKISSPIVWNERDRTVKVTILSQLEDREVGFSAEEGQFKYLPAEMVNKPWPLIFGTVINNPSLSVTTAITGTTLTPVGILAGAELMLSLPSANNVDYEISMMGGGYHKQHLQKVIDAWERADYVTATRRNGQDDASYAADVAAAEAANAANAKMVADYHKQLDDLSDQLKATFLDYSSRELCCQLRRKKKIAEANEKGLGENPIKILGGEDFPQNTPITISIEGGHFTGYFKGTSFYVSSRSSEELTAKANGAYNAKLKDKDVCSMNNTVLKNHWHWKTPVPCGKGDYTDNCYITDDVWTITTINEDAIASREPVIQQFWVEPGASASLYTGDKKVYIASITPGTVLAVRAYKQVSSGVTRLVDVPTDLYSVTSVKYETITAVQIELTKPLSHILDEGWHDDLYVTFKSSVGPNVADILAYIVDQYTDLTCDATSFAHVKTKLAKFPANFPINDRKNVVQTLREIAFQARCAIWFSEGVVYLRYLPEEPTVVDTITESDIDAEKGVEVELTSTEDLVTKMVVNWHLRFATDDRAFTVTLRHNLKKYGTHEQTYDFYIYNQPDIIYKCATFWLIRKSNTWKRVRFTTPLHKLNLETFDAVTLDFAQSYVANGPVTAIIESAKYNSANNCIDFVCLTPVAAGTLMKYPHFWPAALAKTVTWPPQSDIDNGWAGSGGLGSGASGALPVGDTSTIASSPSVFVGGQNIIFGEHSDWGDSTPTDVDFTAQSTVSASDFSGSNATAKETLDLTVDYSTPMTSFVDPVVPSAVTIDLNKTQVFDNSGTTPKVAYLSSILKGVTSDGKLAISRFALVADDAHPNGQPLSDVLKNATDYLAIRTDVSIWDQDDGEHEFDFKYDEDTEKYGAGTAFLQD